MDFRKANANDIRHLIHFRKQMLIDEGFAPVANIDEELSDYFTSGISDGSYISWLAIDNEEIVATGGVCFYRLPPMYLDPAGRVAYVVNMYTLPKYRKQGIASHLLETIIGEVKNLGYKTIRLHASADGKSIYGKMGFVDSEGYMAMKL